MSCWLPWWLSTSVPRPPTLECFSALTTGWTYPSLLPTQTILPIHEAFAPLSPFTPFLGRGCKAQLPGQPYLPGCPLAPTATTSEKMGNGWPKPALCSPPHVKCGSSVIYTSHPLQTLAKWLFLHVSLTASQLCALSKILHFRTLLVNKWIHIKSVKVKGLLYVEGRQFYKLKGTEIIYIKN